MTTTELYDRWQRWKAEAAVWELAGDQEAADMCLEWARQVAVQLGEELRRKAEAKNAGGAT